MRLNEEIFQKWEYFWHSRTIRIMTQGASFWVIIRQHINFFVPQNTQKAPIFRIHLLKMFPYSSFQLIFFPQSRREITSKSLLHLWSLKNARYWETSYLNNFLLAWTLICLKANKNSKQALKRQAHIQLILVDFENVHTTEATSSARKFCSYHWGNVFCEKVLEKRHSRTAIFSVNVVDKKIGRKNNKSFLHINQTWSKTSRWRSCRKNSSQLL